MFSMNRQLSRHVKSADDVAGGGGGASSSKKAASKKRGKAGGGGARAKRQRGMYGALRVSDALAAATGKREMTRSEMTKWFWAHVKKHGLQARFWLGLCACV